MSEEYCSAPECELPVHRLGYCMAHAQQKHRTGKVGAITQKLTPEAKAMEAWLSFVDADPCDDQQYETRRRAALTASKALGRKEHGHTVAEAMAAARARGVHVGRPAKYASVEIQRRYEQLQCAVAVAQALGISPATVYRHLAKGDLARSRLQVERGSP